MNLSVLNPKNLNKNTKRTIILINDFFIFLSVFYLSFFIEENVNFIHSNEILFHFIFVYLIYFFIFFVFDIYSYFLRYINLSLIFNFLNAITLSNIIVFFLKFILELEILSISFFIFFPISLFIFLILSRKILSLVYEFFFDNKQKEKILVFGAGDAGNKSINILNNYEIINFIDDDSNKFNKVLNGIKVKRRFEINNIIKKNQINKIFIAIPSLSNLERMDIINYLKKLRLEIKTLPTVDYLKPNNLEVNDFKNIDYNFILNRKSYEFDYNNFNFISNKTILVTGGGGSIGSELVRQIINKSKNRLIIIDHSELNLHKIKSEIENFTNISELKIDIKFHLGSILDKNFLKNIFQKYKINYIFHSAAYKHVEISEFNLFQTINNNFIGTNNLCEISLESKIEKFILISSDKAVNPTNIMGASKRLSEKCITYYSKFNSTIFSSVRFGNVMGSSGSLIPIFLDQIKKREPLYVRGKTTTRFFMTVSEAVSLVFKASMLAQGGETFILNMGKKILIKDLAKKIIFLSGLKEKSITNPSGDIEIIISDLKKGEKEFEELSLGKLIDITDDNFIKIDNYSNPKFNLRDKVITYKKIINNYNKDALLKELAEDVEGFKF